MTAFPDPDEFVFVPALEGHFEEILLELHALGRERFVDAPDALSLPGGDYDERGWKYFTLFGSDAHCAENRRACPRTARACMLVPGLVNAGFSLFLPGTRLAAHRGELAGTLRCHLPLIVPRGDVGIRSGDETRRWERGRALLFDDSREHTAWNLGEGERVVLLVTFRA
jgi:beta-hydroxylase